jgi:hypothetical protein
LTLFYLDGSIALGDEKQQTRAYNVPRVDIPLKGSVFATIRKGCLMKNHG